MIWRRPILAICPDWIIQILDRGEPGSFGTLPKRNPILYIVHHIENRWEMHQSVKTSWAFSGVQSILTPTLYCAGWWSAAVGFYVIEGWEWAVRACVMAKRLYLCQLLFSPLLSLSLPLSISLFLGLMTLSLSLSGCHSTHPPLPLSSVNLGWHQRLSLPVQSVLLLLPQRDGESKKES